MWLTAQGVQLSLIPFPRISHSIRTTIRTLVWLFYLVAMLYGAHTSALEEHVTLTHSPQQKIGNAVKKLIRKNRFRIFFSLRVRGYCGCVGSSGVLM